MKYSLIITLFCLATTSLYSQDTWEEVQAEFDENILIEWQKSFDSMAVNSTIMFEGILLPCETDTLNNGEVYKICEFLPSHIYRGDSLIDDRKIIYYANYGQPDLLVEAGHSGHSILRCGLYSPVILFLKEVDSTKIPSELFDGQDNIYIEYSHNYYGGYGMSYGDDLKDVEYDFKSGTGYPLYQTILDFEDYIKNWQGVTLPKRKLFYSRKSRLRKLERFMQQYDEQFSFYLD